MAAEALLIFDDGSGDMEALRERAERLRKRSGHLLSKMRYVSAQLLAYIRDDLWLDMARHANAQAARFAAAVEAHPETSPGVFHRSQRGVCPLDRGGIQAIGRRRASSS